MAKFITYYNLCSIHDRKDFLGIAPDRESGNVITTFSKSIVIIKISTQKHVGSWTVLERLSAKVVYDRQSEKYVAAFGSNALRCWDGSINDIKKCKKLKFKKSIDNLVSADEHIYVVYKDGTCELLAEAIQSRKEQVENFTQQQLMRPFAPSLLIDANVRTISDGSRVLTYFQKNSESGDMELVWRPLQSSANALCFKLKRQNSDVRLVGYTVIDGDGAPILFTIWSDKRIFLLNLCSSTLPEKSPGNFVAKLTAFKTETLLTLHGISRNLVAIYGANSGQEGASLLLYNTQFKVVKAKQFFKVHFNFSRLWSFDKHLLLAMGENLSVVSYRNTKDLLAELIGSQINNEFQVPVQADDVDEEEALCESIQYSSDALEREQLQPQSSSKRTKANIKTVEGDGKTVPFHSVDAFNRELTDIAKMQMHVDLMEIENDMEDLHVAVMSNFNDDGFCSPAVQMIVRQMERCGASELEITENLLTVLIKADMLEDIASCLRRYGNISEKMLAKTLSYVLDKHALETQKIKRTSDTINDETHAAAASASNAAEDEMEFAEKEFPIVDILEERHEPIPTLPKAIDVLNAVLACSFDAEAIAAHVRREIDYVKVVVLLEHLYNLIDDDAVTAFEERPGVAPTCIQFELQVLRWFGVFLNTHFQKLALSKDVRLIEVLFKWHKLFELYKREAVNLQSVATLLYNIVQRKSFCKEKNYSKWYSIEEVQLY